MMEYSKMNTKIVLLLLVLLSGCQTSGFSACKNNGGERGAFYLSDTRVAWHCNDGSVKLVGISLK